LQRKAHGVVVPGVDDEGQCLERGDEPMQHCRYGLALEVFRHQGADGLAVLEVLDVLRGGGEIIADLVRHRRLGGQQIDQNLRRARHGGVGR
jgi:hypothetical protein